MYKAFVEERPEGAIHRNPVAQGSHFALNIRLGQGIAPAQEQTENVRTGGRGTEPYVLQDLFVSSSYDCCSH
jgi:hypothetical protein